jgi:transcriptional regulator with XRE-family HTH domain
MPLDPNRLKDRRKAERYSQRSLAAASGVSKATIDNMERGRCREPKHSVITAIAATLGVEPAYFFEAGAVNNQQAAS